MSLDYPDHLRIRERSGWLGLLWRVGDCGYYIGLLGAVMALAGAVSTRHDGKLALAIVTA